MPGSWGPRSGDNQWHNRCTKCGASRDGWVMPCWSRCASGTFIPAIPGSAETLPHYSEPRSRQCSREAPPSVQARSWRRSSKAAGRSLAPPGRTGPGPSGTCDGGVAEFAKFAQGGELTVCFPTCASWRVRSAVDPRRGRRRLPPGCVGIFRGFGTVCREQSGVFANSDSEGFACRTFPLKRPVPES